MTHKIDPSIEHLAAPLENLRSLVGNPRVGNIDAICASYNEFGQVKPIVVRPNDDGTMTVIAGNHQFQAVQRLGWSHIAVVPMYVDDARAMAFAIADNRTNELGHTDDDLLADALGQIIDDYGDLLEDLEWDEFELAMLDLSTETQVTSTPGLYEQPIIKVIDTDEPVAPPALPSQSNSAPVSTRDSEGEVRLEAPKDSDTKALVTQGATSGGMSGSSKAVVQYSLVFDSPEQQRRWYDFLRWMRSDAGVDGETTAEKLIDFLEQHADF
jgi:hypothetical protein